MNTNRKNAIVAGILFITATLTGILFVAFVTPILDDPDYLIKVAENESMVILGALLQTTMGFAGASIAIWLYPVLREHNKALALGAVALRLIEGVLFIVSAVTLLSLLTLCQLYVNAGAPDVSHFQILGALYQAEGDWLSTGPAAIGFCLGALLYYAVFYQSQRIPRWLSGWGFVAAAMHLFAALFVMFGQEPFSTIILILNFPIFLNEMVLAVWLIMKGFNPPAIAS